VAISDNPKRSDRNAEDYILVGKAYEVGLCII
jgi:hypothetical protein